MVAQPCNLSIYESEAEGLQFKAHQDKKFCWGWWDSSLPEFDDQNQLKREKREPSQQSCPLTSTWIHGMHIRKTRK